VQQRMPIVLQGEFTFVRGLLSDPDPVQFTARVNFFNLVASTAWTLPPHYIFIANQQPLSV
jgi:hypothetical protein